jgi:predicted amidohydrolase YtcJ
VLIRVHTIAGEASTRHNDDLLVRIKALGAIPTPFSTYVYYHGEKMRYYGAERLNHMFALHSFLDAGIRPTQASDYPPGEFIPIMALQSEVTPTDTQGNVWGPKRENYRGGCYSDWNLQRCLCFL